MSPIIRPMSIRRFGVALAVAPALFLIACTHDQPKAAVPTVATVAAPSLSTEPYWTGAVKGLRGNRRL